VPALFPTPSERLLDARGRPYFLWDMDLTADALRARLRDGSREERAYLVGKIMRQAKPDDVFAWAPLAVIEDLWPSLEKYLGRSREFWRWILSEWGCKVRG
jgi:hypothetical protein